MVEMSSNEHITDNATSHGFLSGFIESSVEMPVDGLNGECIVHYGGEHSKCEMFMTLVNGKREGDALIVNDGIRYLKLHYERGSLTGVVERMDEFGFVDMRGHLENGIESGFFKEYNKRKKVVWIGFYRNGQRYLEVRNRDMKSDCLEDGSGELYELDENGRVTQLCLYVNGVRSRVIQKFNGEVMTELDENERRVYEGGFSGDMENGFVREGKGKEFVNGGRMAVYYGEWKNGKRDGQGTEYKRFNPVYRGGWKDGKRGGKGEEMDENGEVVRNGWWVDGVYENDISELRMEDNSSNDSSVTEMKLNGLARLKRIVIGNDCFGNVRSFELDGLSELEIVKIGHRSFKISDYNQGDGTYRIVNCPKLKSIRIGNSSFSDYNSFELTNVPSLQSIDIGVRSFYWAPSFSLTGWVD